MKKIILFLCLILSQFSFSQNGVTLLTGVNRVGFFTDLTVNPIMKNHQIDFGLRYYYVDYFFEKEIVGFNLGYNYNFNFEKVYFSPSFHATFFREMKSPSEVYLMEFTFSQRLGLSVGERSSVFFKTGLGITMNKFQNFQTGQTGVMSYVNYELALGYRYIFGH